MTSAPIPGCPADEFDTYAGLAFGMLRRGGKAEEAAAYLGQATEAVLGLDPAPAHDLKIARKAWTIVNTRPTEP